MLKTQQTTHLDVLDLLDDMAEAIELIGHVNLKVVIVDQLRRAVDSLNLTMLQTVEFVGEWTDPGRSRVRGECQSPQEYHKVPYQPLRLIGSLHRRISRGDCRTSKGLPYLHISLRPRGGC